MGGFSWLTRRPGAAGDPTHALFAAQSHSIVDNLMALFERSRAWHCSSQERALADINGSLKGQCAPSHVRYRLAVMTPGISCIARSPTILRLADTAFEKRRSVHPWCSAPTISAGRMACTGHRVDRLRVTASPKGGSVCPRGEEASMDEFQRFNRT